MNEDEEFIVYEEWGYSNKIDLGPGIDDDIESLLEKTVFVTGGALGIGAEIVTAFAKQGSKVGFLDLDLDASKKLAKKLGDNVHFEICDLNNISAMQT